MAGMAEALQIALVIRAALLERHDVVPLRGDLDPAGCRASHTQRAASEQARVALLPLAASYARGLPLLAIPGMGWARTLRGPDQRRTARLRARAQDCHTHTMLGVNVR